VKERRRKKKDWVKLKTMDAMKADIPRQRTVSSELNRIQLDEAIREREKKRGNESMKKRRREN
jgi:hypothetical protein